ncbi:cerebellin-2-like [Gigantopelta aegis]|uniref:cerebellin-2-like n=1 Tax=Gigantopelta aegis TaxID=1735272 RepID=UPI001B88A5CC|nr:cerebellin-2-like [Gigantopelta aegis]
MVGHRGCSVVVLAGLFNFAICFFPPYPIMEKENTGTADDADTDSRSLFETLGPEPIPICDCNKEIDIMVKGMRAAYGRMESMQRRVDEMSSQLFSLQESMKVVPARLARLGIQPYDVAFSAKVAANRPFLRDIDTVIFDEIVVNNGGAYDPFTGRFTCPIAGIYHFACTILSGFNTTIETMFYLNGNDVGRIYSGAQNNRGSGSNSILLQMKEADQLSINVFYGNGDYVHGQWSTFSGFLVNPLNL